jgi:hypothetical protein
MNQTDPVVVLLAAVQKDIAQHYGTTAGVWSLLLAVIVKAVWKRYFRGRTFSCGNFTCRSRCMDNPDGSHGVSFRIRTTPSTSTEGPASGTTTDPPSDHRSTEQKLEDAAKQLEELVHASLPRAPPAVETKVRPRVMQPDQIDLSLSSTLSSTAETTSKATTSVSPSV